MLMSRTARTGSEYGQEGHKGASPLEAADILLFSGPGKRVHAIINIQRGGVHDKKGAKIPDLHKG